MATTSSLGIGSGVDLQSMLTKLMAAERTPITALDTKIAEANTKISLYGTLSSKLDTFKSAAETLQFPSKLSAVTASTSDATIVVASATYNAAVGTYGIQTTALASAQKSISAGYVAGTTFSGGNLKFTVGEGSQQTITFDSGNYTLQDISTRINDAKTGVTATIVNTSDGGQRMILTSDKSGAANGFSMTSTLVPSDAPGTVADPTPVPQASLASFDATKGTPAADATMLIDDIEVSSSTNQFVDKVTGISFTAVKLGTATVSIQNDGAKISAAVKAFVESYNAVATTIKTNSTYNATTKTAAGFNGDATARSVLGTLGNTRTTVPTELSTATYKALSELGVTVQQNGLLSLDTAQLTNTINSSPTEVIKTLSAYGKSFADAISSMQSSGGSVTTRVDGLNNSIKRYKDNQETLELRVSLIEKRYRAQFSALDKYVSTMSTTSSYLSQQFAKL